MAIPLENANIVLIGMMGAGKSTVGRRLAHALSRRFVDADKAIEQRCGVPIPTIFEVEGEAGFRRRETALLDELTREHGLVIATGGGAVLEPQNRRLLRERGYVVYLQAALPELWHRLRHDRARPLLQTANPRQRIAELLAVRDPLYSETAHLSVLTGRQPVEQLVAEVLARLPAALASPYDAAAQPSACISSAHASQCDASAHAVAARDLSACPTSKEPSR